MQQQMNDNAMVRQLQRDDDKSYKKTNFGPEETEDDIRSMTENIRRKKKNAHSDLMA